MLFIQMPPPPLAPAGMMTTLGMAVSDVPTGKVPLPHPLIGNQTDPNAAIALAQRVRGETGMPWPWPCPLPLNLTEHQHTNMFFSSTQYDVVMGKTEFHRKHKCVICVIHSLITLLLLLFVLPGQSGTVTQMILLCPHPPTNTTNGLMTGSIWAPHPASPKEKVKHAFLNTHNRFQTALAFCFDVMISKTTFCWVDIKYNIYPLTLIVMYYFKLTTLVEVDIVYPCCVFLPQEGKRMEKTASLLTMNLRRNSGKRTSG